MKAFILAGGFATRLWPLTEKRAKPLLPLAGKPILTRLVEKIPSEIEVTVSTNAVFSEGFFAWKNSIGRKINIAIEDAKNDNQKLGALGAVKKWIEEEKTEDDILLLTGDNYVGFDIGDFIDSRSQDAPLLAAYDIGDVSRASAFGVVELASDGKTLAGFQEKPANPCSTLISTGCSIIPKRRIPVLVEFAKTHPDNVGGIFEEFIGKGIKVECFTFTEKWFDIGSFASYLEATISLAGNSVIKEKESQITNSSCWGSVVLGKGSKAINCKLENVVMFENCTAENCDLYECVLDNNCVLKGVDLRGKMIRENTKLIDQFQTTA
ncbi:MAG: Sugar nucleotidyltransferase [Candidatus Uhrbacteria bacterium GW2011_GWA2_53_10]|uniref:Sugar nucleotidyltransferase n=1 Tax=Candidatus Uhrbacteria bacterium GW2011_GWA2_53_10 TaxID=1618980 RepID=A0A0G1XNQ0_9BACT|nr:MAG: Sugar nucleotidyltransferase [Candidatus Uhrbacteria bacterium GW2011_GWA2_53_10]